MKRSSKDYSIESQLNLKAVIGIHRSSLREQRHTLRLVSAYGITLAQFGVMEALYHLGPMRVSQLIRKTLSTGGNMTVVIRNLEKEGYIVRCADSEDKRASVVHLSDKGIALIEEIFPRHLESLNDLLKALDSYEKTQLVHLLKKLNGVHE